MHEDGFRKAVKCREMQIIARRLSRALYPTVPFSRGFSPRSISRTAFPFRNTCGVTKREFRIQLQNWLLHMKRVRDRLLAAVASEIQPVCRALLSSNHEMLRKVFLIEHFLPLFFFFFSFFFFTSRRPSGYFHGAFTAFCSTGSAARSNRV